MEIPLGTGEHETYRKTLRNQNEVIITNRRAIAVSKRLGPSQHDLSKVVKVYADQEGMFKKYYQVRMVVQGNDFSVIFVITPDKQERDEVIQVLQGAMLGAGASEVP